MKTNYLVTLLFIIIGLFNKSFCQKDSMDIKPVIGISLHAGTMTYYGALNTKAIPFTSDNKINAGIGLNLKYKAISLSLNYDKISFGQTLNTPTEHRNFKASGNMLGMDINYWPLIKKNYGFYIGTGISYAKYDLWTDTLDVKGVKYNYWSDGTIRDQVENYDNNFTSIKIKKDYKYESSLGSKGMILYPVKAGVMLRFIKDVQLTLSTGYYFTNKNDADGYTKGNKKNYFMYNTASLIWYFNSYDKVDKGIYKDINFKDLLSSDEDGDGVSDGNDKCLGTVKGAKIDNNGCPVDSDKDGVDDYKDKEKNTDKKKLTDLNGIGSEPGDPNNVDQSPDIEENPEPK